jgi:DNA-binding CsgD family transcriptional regulator
VILVGRERERATLRELFDEAARGRGGLVVILGEPGIGKSALVADLTAYAEPMGAVVLAGRAAEGGGAYRPIAEALMPAVRAGLVRETEDLRPFRSALGRVLPGWASAWPAEPGVDPVLLLGEGVLRLLLTTDATVRVLVLDGLQYADPDTIALLEYLAPAVEQLPILIVATQSLPPPAPHIDRLPAIRIRLTRLSPVETAALVDHVRPLPRPVRDGIVERAEGLPLVAVELAADPQPTSSSAMPASLAALVGDRLARLDADARRLVGAAAVLGAPSTWTLVPPLAELDMAGASAAYSRAVELGLLVPEAGQLRWSHGLVREIIVSSLLPIERQQLNQRAAELLLGLDTDDGDATAAERLVAAGETGQAAEVLLRLARRAIERGGLRSAEQLLERAAALGRPVEVALLRVELLTMIGRDGEALAIGASALAEARHDQHAELCLRMARAAVGGRRWQQVEDLVVRAGRPDDPRSLILLADAAFGAGRVTEAARLAARAVQASADAAAEVRCEALCVRGRISGRDDLATAVDSFRQAAQVAGEHGLPLWRAEALFGQGTCELKGEERSDSLREAGDLAGDLGLLRLQGQAEMLLADWTYLTKGPGPLVEPAALLRDRGALLGLPVFTFVGELLLATREALAGDRRAMEERLARMETFASIPPDNLGQLAATRAIAALVGHDLPSAKKLLDEAARPLVEHRSTAPMFHFALWPVIAACVDGPAEKARAVVRGRHGGLRRSTVGALHYADAIVAGREGRLAEAVAAYSAGDELLAPVEWWRRFLRLFTLEAAVLDGWGDPVPVLRADLGAYERSGEAQLARICRDTLRRAGVAVRRGRGDSTVSAALRAHGVTSREVDVLILLSRGLTNAAISEQLFLSPRTVETHVASLLAKSGTANRQQLRDWGDSLTP